jgi:hypothetical protein
MDTGLRRIVIAAGLIALIGTLIGCAARPVMVPSASAPSAATPSSRPAR